MRRSKIIYLTVSLLFVVTVAVLSGCTQEETGVEEQKQEQQAATEKEKPKETEEPVKKEKTKPSQKVEITVGERSPSIDGAKAAFETPKDGGVLQEKKVSVVVNAENFETGVQTETERAKEIANSEDGQHFHVILDNQPYMANYKAGEPFDIGTLEEGPHTVITFPSRSYHESVKSKDGADVVNFYVVSEEGEFLLDESQPAIIYSRPKGEYKGKDAEKIMLDFYLLNVELSPDGYKAKYTIRKKGEKNSELYSITLTEWKPAFVTGLSTGDYVVTLELLDKDGNTVKGGFNFTEREISVVAYRQWGQPGRKKETNK